MVPGERRGCQKRLTRGLNTPITTRETTLSVYNPTHTLDGVALVAGNTESKVVDPAVRSNKLGCAKTAAPQAPPANRLILGGGDSDATAGAPQPSSGSRRPAGKRAELCDSQEGAGFSRDDCTKAGRVLKRSLPSSKLGFAKRLEGRKPQSAEDRTHALGTDGSPLHRRAGTRPWQATEHP